MALVVADHSIGGGENAAVQRFDCCAARCADLIDTADRLHVRCGAVRFLQLDNLLAAIEVCGADAGVWLGVRLPVDDGDAAAGGEYQKDDRRLHHDNAVTD